MKQLPTPSIKEDCTIIEALRLAIKLDSPTVKIAKYDVNTEHYNVIFFDVNMFEWLRDNVKEDHPEKHLNHPAYFLTSVYERIWHPDAKNSTDRYYHPSMYDMINDTRGYIIYDDGKVWTKRG